MKGLVQIAGVLDLGEALMLAECGVEQVGLPLRLARGADELSELEAARIVAALPRATKSVLITYLTDVAAIAELAAKLGVDLVQLHAEVSAQALSSLRRAAPRLRVIKSLIVREGNLQELQASVERFSPHVDAFLTDTFDPATGACGSTGRTHDWEVSRRVVDLTARPVILAGGLTPENVARGILKVRPAGVDAHTGVEAADGRKSRERVRRFVAEARAAFRRLGRTPEADDG